MTTFKIFKKGEFSEVEINDFFTKNIILKDKYLENGDIYVFFKPNTEIGLDIMDKVEQVDRMIVQAEKEIFTSEIEISKLNKKIAVDKTDKEATEDKTEKKRLEKEIEQFERDKKMSEYTIKERQAEIDHLKEFHKELINKE